MQPSAFEEILQKISGTTDHISLHVLGEALLHPEFELFLVMSRANGLRVNLSTNGTLLAENRAMLLRQPALRQVNISLHSFERSGQESALDSYLDGVFTFIDAAVPATPLFINLRLWNLLAADTGEQFMNRLMLRRLEDYFGLPIALSEDFSTGRGITLTPQVFLSRERRFAWPHAPAPDLGAHGYCRGLHDHIAILVDGTVVPCCLDAEGDIRLGNILQSTLAAILASPRAALIREGFARQRVMEPVCRRCTYRQRFRRNNPVKAAIGLQAKPHQTIDLNSYTRKT